MVVFIFCENLDGKWNMFNIFKCWLQNRCKTNYKWIKCFWRNILPDHYGRQYYASGCNFKTIIKRNVYNESISLAQTFLQSLLCQFDDLSLMFKSNYYLSVRNPPTLKFFLQSERCSRANIYVEDEF